MRGGYDLYVIQMAVTGDFKVGRTSNLERRVSEIQTGCPYPLRVLLLAPGQGHREKSLHRRLRAHRCRNQSGEWFLEGALGLLPDDLWELVPAEVLEDPDWWKRDHRR